MKKENFFSQIATFININNPRQLSHLKSKETKKSPKTSRFSGKLLYYKLAKSSILETFITSISPFIFFIIPFKILPGPIS